MSFVERWKKAASGKQVNSEDSSSEDEGAAGSAAGSAAGGTTESGAEEQRGMRLPKFMYDDEGFLDSERFKYGLEALKGLGTADGVNPKFKERYLEDGEFEKTFGMNIEKFCELRLWKQKELKRKVGLF